MGAQAGGLEDLQQPTSQYIPQSTRTEAMLSVSLITLLAFTSLAHAEEAAADVSSMASDDSMDKFTDMLVEKLADKLFDATSANAPPNEDELDQVEDGPDDDAQDDQTDEDEQGEVDADELDENELAEVLGLRGGA